jgi:hypothetical protein
MGSWMGAGRAPSRLRSARRPVEVGADAVHLVDEGEARARWNLSAWCHDRLGLRLDAVDGREHDHGAVEDAQAALDLDREVDVPGVSMRCSSWSAQVNMVVAAVMVMPRSRSCGIQSIWVSPSWTSPILWILPVERKRSVTVVLPASIWATIPMFRRVRSSPWRPQLN